MTAAEPIRIFDRFIRILDRGTNVPAAALAGTLCNSTTLVPIERSAKLSKIGDGDEII
jgi:hypothetical protein